MRYGLFPKATISEIIGLLEVINDVGGKEDVAQLAADFNLGLDDMLPSIDAAQMLEFVVVNDGNIELTGDAKKLLDSGIKERKNIIKDKVTNVKIIKELENKLMESEYNNMDKKDVIKFLQKMICNTNIESYFNIIINWTRYVGLFGYNSDSEEIYLISSRRRKWQIQIYPQLKLESSE